MNYRLLSACQGEMEPFKDHPSLSTHCREVWHASETNHSKNRLGYFHDQYQYLPELLVNVYSYRLMVKSVSCCCVHGRQIFSNLSWSHCCVSPELLERAAFKQNKNYIENQYKWYNLYWLYKLQKYIDKIPLYHYIILLSGKWKNRVGNTNTIYELAT